MWGRAAGHGEVPADAFAPGGNLGRIGLGERIGAGVQRGIAVLVVNACPHAIDSLPYNALHAIKRGHALWRSPTTARSRPASTWRLERYHRTTWPATEAPRPAGAGRQPRPSGPAPVSGAGPPSKAPDGAAKTS